ncbi:glycosyltransferase [Geobacter sp. 60473]|uniref:glycosyltransferase n=1 Tax=Geobacter sp. 60473 TaxID=3080755 RepID=UPI002B2842F5|nr:glycosyltransferase [Geobacter sp. 60473]
MKIGLQTWGSEGDVRPFVALAAGLVRAGHHVTLVVTDDPARDYSAQAEQYGFSLRMVPNTAIADPAELDVLRQSIIAAGNPLRQAEMIMTHGFDPVMERMYAASRELCAASELVIGHFFVFPLRVAAERAGVPVASVNLVHNCIPSAQVCPPGLPDLGRWFYPLGWKLARAVINRIFLPRVNALRLREGLVPDRDVMGQTWAAERLNLIAVSRRFCSPPSDWDRRHRVCGFLSFADDGAGEPFPPGLDDFLAVGPAPVYFTFGSMMSHNMERIRETAALWRQAVMLAGCRAVFQLPCDDPSEFDDGSRIFAVRRSPYAQVFPCCAAVVHHGGAGTTQSSLRAGVPSVVVAHMADQTFWGSELRRLGVAGRTLGRNGLSARALATEIGTVLATPAMADTAAAIGREIASEDGVGLAVRLIEETFANESHAACLWQHEPSVRNPH